MPRSLTATVFVLCCLAGSATEVQAAKLTPMWDVYVATDYMTKYEVVVEHYNGTTSSRGVFCERWEAEIEVIYAENYDPYGGAPVSAAVARVWIEEVEVPSRWKRYGRYPTEFGAAFVTSLLEYSGVDAYYVPILVLDLDSIQIEVRK